MFYTFRQNNSGGRFDFQPDKGIGRFVIVEAKTRQAAIQRAERIGLYFDGCRNGRDCYCCGDRWQRYHADDPTKRPSIDDVRLPARPYRFTSRYVSTFDSQGNTGYIHFLTGRIAPIKGVSL